ncbi:MAG: hypothetical protein ACO37Y_05025, partial [Steroidobacteraceae bacterium]
LGGLSGGSQMDLSPLFQKAAASVQKMNAELATSKKLTSATYRETLADVKAFEAAVVAAKTKEASMTKANPLRGGEPSACSIRKPIPSPRRQ